MRFGMPLSVVLIVAAAAASAPAQQGEAPGPLLTRPDQDWASAAEGLSAPLAPAASFEEQLVELVNVERLNCGAGEGCPKPPLKHQANLIVAAEEHSSSMALNDYVSHLDFAVSCIGVGTRMNNAGYTGWTAGGENIAAGQSSPANVMASWMGSSGHRSNILSSSYREIGAGYLNQGGDQSTVDVDANTDCDCLDAGFGETCSGGPFVHYWTQVFGARGGTTGYPVIIEREKFAIASPAADLYLYQPPGTGAQMSFANETGGFTAPQAFSTAVADWNLTPGDGLKTVIAVVTTSSGTFRTCDRIWLSGSGDTSFVFADGFECDGVGAWTAVGF